jgi:PadR family transcriptional regulator PadR
MNNNGVDDAELANWMTQLRKGILELCIFNLLAQGELYGYDLVKRLATLPGIVVSEGTIYPLLARLRRAGFLDTRLEESPSGPARRYYVLTKEGTRARDQMNTYWEGVVVSVDELAKRGTHHG